MSDWHFGLNVTKRKRDSKCQRIGFDVKFESGEELHDASSQLRSLRLEHAHHKVKAG